MNLTRMVKWAAIVALALPLAAGDAPGAPLPVTFTAPSLNADGTPCTDLATFRFWAVLCHDTADTLGPWDFPAGGTEGQQVNVDLPIPAGNVGWTWVRSLDSSFNISDRSNYLTFAIPATAQGLAASYYAGRDFDSLAVSRVDSTINFVWEGAAWAGGPADSFSVRWIGELNVLIAGQHNLYFTSDDGRTMDLDYIPIMDFWVPTWSEGSWSGWLEAGVHPITVEMFERSGTARAVLYWSGPGFDREVVPAWALSH